MSRRLAAAFVLVTSLAVTLVTSGRWSSASVGSATTPPDDLFEFPSGLRYGRMTADTGSTVCTVQKVEAVLKKWPTAAELPACRSRPSTVTEECFAETFSKRYRELTSSYRRVLASGPTEDLERTLGLGLRGVDKAADLPGSLAQQAWPVSKTLGGAADESFLRPLLSRLTFSNGNWTLNGAALFQGGVVITPYLADLKSHGKNGEEFVSPVRGESFFKLERYSKGAKVLDGIVFLSDGRAKSMSVRHPYQFSETLDEPKTFALAGYGILDVDVVETITLPISMVDEAWRSMESQEVMLTPILTDYLSKIRLQLLQLDARLASLPQK